MNKRKLCKVYNFILIMFLVFISTVIFNSKTLEKGIRTIQTKKLEQEGQNYRLVTSQDNVQVPVPKGYVASSITGENYVIPEYSHTTITHKVSATPTVLTWSSPTGETYPWTQDESGIWISGNQGIPSSTSALESEEFDYIKGTTLTINYTYSSQSGDNLNIYLIDLTNNKTTTIVSNESGNTGTSFDYTTSNYTYTMNNWGTGRYKIQAKYRKNASTDGGLDSGYIKGATYFKEDENGETIEVDQKTKIHDGGFVIYQLTDEEIETDPNGTNVIINDTNKDDEQSERNQYVWVPVQNVEDIVRTKVANNGIMQFGQEYRFSNTAISKETYTTSGYYSEPRLVEGYDKTKYYLQRYSYIDKERENYLNNQQEDYTKMIESINKYKGYYIGRYETGDEDEHSSSKKCFTNPRVVRYNSNIGNVTWYDSYKDLQRLSGKTQRYVETGMLYDSLWDYTLKWLHDTDTRNYEEIIDSGTWGNYNNNGFKYKLSANGTESTKNANSSRMTSTGGITEITYKGETYSNSQTSSNNIFDIAGNVYEWTRSRSSNAYRRIRGGNYLSVSSFTPVRDVSNYNPYDSGNYVGVRGQLYIL